MSLSLLAGRTVPFTVCMLGHFIFHDFVVVFFKIFVFTFFQEHYQSAKRFDPDQVRGPFSPVSPVGPDLGPKCLQAYQHMNKNSKRV